MNNYHIYEEIGRGKYSVVYKGRKKKTIQYVAVKSVERCRRKKLMNEVRIFHNLEHKKCSSQTVDSADPDQKSIARHQQDPRPWTPLIQL